MATSWGISGPLGGGAWGPWGRQCLVQSAMSAVATRETRDSAYVGLKQLAALERIRTVSACHGTNADGLACDERLSAVQHLYSIALQVYWTHERRSTHAAAINAGLRKSVQRLTGAEAPAGASDAELKALVAQANGFEDAAAAQRKGMEAAAKSRFVTAGGTPDQWDCLNSLTDQWHCRTARPRQQQGELASTIVAAPREAISTLSRTRTTAARLALGLPGKPPRTRGKNPTVAQQQDGLRSHAATILRSRQPGANANASASASASANAATPARKANKRSHTQAQQTDIHHFFGKKHD